MSMTISTNGKRILKSLRKVDANTLRGIRKAFYQIGSSLKRNANNEILRGQKTGRTYVITRGATKRRHKASAPGEAWANISGNARRSIDYSVFGGTNMTFSGGGNKAKYVPYLEKGTSKMRPRPALKNALDDERRNIEKYIGRHVIKEVKD